ncbi:response regulator [Reichenbachiella ulvae]|uniref:Response regulator transcription factor n=1 Tax=Reichenbachiella ulvae TaxID=2980104 RepID=A0ABT3CN91_9BACT|nr:response regulator transcription factor [Reichenbachiella ulvae]MCV9385205.1 response regulator transcription factor [Reichenbachiella ulvae]
MIKVLIADDHSLIRKGVKTLLSNNGQVSIIGESTDGYETLEEVRKLKPDVLITDISMPGLTGIEITKKIVEEKLDTRVLILTTYFDEEYIMDSYEAGASGYLPKTSSEDQILAALLKINSQETYYSEEVMEVLSKSIFNKSKREKDPKPSLTERETEMLKELVEGSTNKEIASKFFISTRTVDAHRRNIMKKLNVNNSAQLVKYSIENKLV